MNIDLVENADIIHDLNFMPWPIADDYVEEVFTSHCLEHLVDPLGALREITRVCRLGSRVEIRVPHPLADLAMTVGHLHVLAPLGMINICEVFVDDFFPGVRRLRLDETTYAPTIYLEQAKAELPFLAGLDDQTIMRWIPRTAHESRFVLTVVAKT